MIIRGRLANAVGYQNLKVNGNNGITWAVATMQQVGVTEENMTLASFAFPTDKNFLSGDSIVLEIYNENGTCDGEYSFVDTANADLYSLKKTGWYPLEKIRECEVTDDDLSNSVVVPFGKGVIITSGESDTVVTFAGQVASEAKSFEVKGNNRITWTGNASPVDLKLGDLAIPADKNFLSADSIVLEIYNENGTCDGEYSFVDTANADLYSLKKTGWYPLKKIREFEATDDDCANEIVTVSAGKMVIVTSGEADTTLTVPSALTK